MLLLDRIIRFAGASRSGAAGFMQTPADRGHLQFGTLERLVRDLMTLVITEVRITLHPESGQTI